MWSYALILAPVAVHAALQRVLDDRTRGPAYSAPIAFRPPGYVFGIVWTTLYLLMGVYLYLLVRARATSPAFRTTPWLFGALVAVYVANFALNAAWMPVVNRYERVVLGIYLIVAMLACAFAALHLDPDPVRRLCWVPYVAWLFAALALNVELARMYRRRPE